MKILKNKKVIIAIIVAVIVITISVFCAIKFLGNKDKNENNDGNNNIGIDNLIGNENTPITESTEEGRDLQEETKSLNNTYSDVIGWLKIPGTSIDTPIFKSTNNDRYLRHDRDNNYAMWGEEFLDYRCNINNMTDKSHFIIYGHNTKEDNNFTPLLNYKNENFLNEHKIIEFSTLNGNYRWEIFATYVTNTDFFYIDTEFANENEYAQFLYTLEHKRMYNTNVELIGDETILTLSTCDYSMANGRFVVQAKLIAE